MPMEEKRMSMSKRASLFVDRIENGSIQKRYLTNHGFEYTNGPEGIAEMRFDRYIVSCGHRLMKKRIEMEDNRYHG